MVSTTGLVVLVFGVMTPLQQGLSKRCFTGLGPFANAGVLEDHIFLQNMFLTALGSCHMTLSNVRPYCPTLKLGPNLVMQWDSIKSCGNFVFVQSC